MTSWQYKENQRYGLWSIDIRSFDVLGETYTTTRCSTFLRHMNVVSDTVSNEHLVNDFWTHWRPVCIWHMWRRYVTKEIQSTSWGLEIIDTKQGLRGKKQYRTRRILIEYVRLEKIEIVCKYMKTLYSNGTRVSNFLRRSRIFELSRSERKTHLHDTMENTYAIRNSITTHTSAHSQN